MDKIRYGTERYHSVRYRYRKSAIFMLKNERKVMRIHIVCVKSENFVDRDKCGLKLLATWRGANGMSVYALWEQGNWRSQILR